MIPKYLNPTLILKTFVLIVILLLGIPNSWSTFSRIKRPKTPNELSAYEELMKSFPKGAFCTKGVLIHPTLFLMLKSDFNKIIDTTIRIYNYDANFTNSYISNQFAILKLEEPVPEVILSVPIFTGVWEFKQLFFAGFNKKHKEIVGDHFTSKYIKRTNIVLCSNPIEHSLEKSPLQAILNINHIGAGAYIKTNEGIQLAGLINGGTSLTKNETKLNEFSIAILDKSTIEKINELISQEAKLKSDPSPGGTPQNSPKFTYPYWRSTSKLNIRPYLQPGPLIHSQTIKNMEKNNSKKKTNNRNIEEENLLNESETITVLWQSNQNEKSISVRAKREDESNYIAAQLTTKKQASVIASRISTLFEATFFDLQKDSKYTYEILEGEEIVYSSMFETRKTNCPFNFVLVGDSGSKDKDQEDIIKAISAQYSVKPINFGLHTGDAAYELGRKTDYLTAVFKYFNNLSEDNQTIMNKMVWHFTAGNHDLHQQCLNYQSSIPITSTDPRGNDSLGFFSFMSLPLNGPELEHKPELEYEDQDQSNTEDIETEFEKNLGVKFPRILNYYFTYGNALFIVLDGNKYDNRDWKNLDVWIEKILSNTNVKWKFVSIHQPPFSSYLNNFEDRKTRLSYFKDSLRSRLLLKFCKKYEIDVVFSGHLHTYERTKPLKFELNKYFNNIDNKQDVYEILSFILTSGLQYTTEDDPSNFKSLDFDDIFNIKADSQFDGKSNTVADGTIFIISGAGGHGLINNKVLDEPVITKYFANGNCKEYSFTHVEVDENYVFIKQIGTFNQIIDELKISKKDSAGSACKQLSSTDDRESENEDLIADIIATAVQQKSGENSLDTQGTNSTINTRTPEYDQELAKHLSDELDD